MWWRGRATGQPTQWPRRWLLLQLRLLLPVRLRQHRARGGRRLQLAARRRPSRARGHCAWGCDLRGRTGGRRRSQTLRRHALTCAPNCLIESACQVCLISYCLSLCSVRLLATQMLPQRGAMQAAGLMLALGNIWMGAVDHLLLQKLRATLRLALQGRRQQAGPALQRPVRSCHSRAAGPWTWADQRAALHEKHMRRTVLSSLGYPADQGKQPTPITDRRSALVTN